MSLLGSGCAVLTKSQVAEVKSFAAVAHNYGTLPGEPIRLYAAASRYSRLVTAASSYLTNDIGRDRAWDRLTKANAAEKDFTEIANQADATLDVITQYADVLLQLTSDDYANALDAAAASGGKALDKAITAYNEAFNKSGGKKLGLVGSTVAGVIRGAGGVGIHAKQAKYLKEYVIQGEPVINAIGHDVSLLATNKMLPHLDALEKQLRDDFFAAGNRFELLDPLVFQETADTVRNIGAARELCRLAASAASKMSAAHAKLRERVSRRHELKDYIEEIQALADDIIKADKVRRSLKK